MPKLMNFRRPPTVERAMIPQPPTWDDSPDLHITVDAAGVVTYANATAREYGITVGNPLPSSLASHHHDALADARQVSEIDALLTHGDQPRTFHFVHRHVADGSHLVGRDLSQFLHRQRRKDLEDPLTGLPNRLAFETALLDAWSVASQEGWNVGIVYLDVNRLKMVNDTYGHSAGDEVIRSVAQSVASALRDSDAVFRIGGDEFVAICHNVTDESLRSIHRRVAHAARTRCTFESEATGQEITVTTSAAIGSVLVTHADLVKAPGALREALHRADTAMYDNKRARSATIEQMVRRMATQGSWPLQVAHFPNAERPITLLIQLANAGPRRAHTANAIRTVTAEPAVARALAAHVVSEGLAIAKRYGPTEPDILLAVPPHADLTTARDVARDLCATEDINPRRVHVGVLVEGVFCVAQQPTPTPSVIERVRPRPSATEGLSR